MTERVVTVCLSGFPGCDRLLGSLQRTTRLTRHISLASAVPGGPESDFVAEYVRERRPELVIFGAWSPVYAALLEDLRGESASFGVYWSSSVGQTGLAKEISKLAAVLREPRIEHVLFVSEAFYHAVEPHLPRARYLPPTLDVEMAGGEHAGSDDASGPAPRRNAADGSRISLFSPLPELGRKNALNCLLALAGLPRDYTLYLNGLTADAGYRVLVEALEIPHRDLGWMERAQYDRTLDEIDLGLQPSFSESFSYIAAEHLIRGIPVLGTAAVPVLRRLSPEIGEHLIVANPDDPADIRSRLEFLTRQPEVRVEIGARAREELVRRVARDNERAARTLDELVDGSHGRDGPARRRPLGTGGQRPEDRPPDDRRRRT